MCHMTQTTKPTPKDKRWQKIDEAIDNSIEPSPDSAHALAELLDEHPTIVVRRLHKRFKQKGRRWVWKGKESHAD